jgi:hypothetical protein
MPNNTSQANNIPSEPYRTVTPARAEDWLRTIYQTVNSQPAASTSQAAVITSPPRARGWVLVSTRAGLEFEASRYTNNTQTQALARFVKSVKDNIKAHVLQVNCSLSEITRLKQVIAKAEALVVDDTVSPAAPGESRASEQPAYVAEGMFEHAVYDGIIPAPEPGTTPDETPENPYDATPTPDNGYDSSIDIEVTQALNLNSSGATPEPTLSAFDSIPDLTCGNPNCDLCCPEEQ